MSAFGSLFGNNGFVYDEIFIISSHSLYKDVAKDLGLGVQYYVKKGFLKSSFEFKDYPVEVTPAARYARHLDLKCQIHTQSR